MQFCVPVGMTAVDNPLAAHNQAVASLRAISYRIIPLFAFHAERASQVYHLVSFSVFARVLGLAVATVAIVQGRFISRKKMQVIRVSDHVHLPIGAELSAIS